MQLVEENVQCPNCNHLYVCKTYFLENGECITGKLRSYNENCISKKKFDGKLYITAKCPKCNFELDITLEEK